MRYLLDRSAQFICQTGHKRPLKLKTVDKKTEIDKKHRTGGLGHKPNQASISSKSSCIRLVFICSDACHSLIFMPTVNHQHFKFEAVNSNLGFTS